MTSYIGARAVSDDQALLVAPRTGSLVNEYNIGGWAASTDGFSYIEELATDAVPSTAAFVDGIAHTQDGARYVTSDLPASSDVNVDGVLCRQDGAMRVRFSEPDVVYFLSGLPCDQSGVVFMEFGGTPAWVREGAIFDFDFINNRYWAAGRTLTFSSVVIVGSSANGWIETEAGVWSPVAANTLRRSDKGALVETTSSNRAKHCRDLTQALWTKSNVTPVKDQTGIDGVANSCSRITSSAGNGTCLQAITNASDERIFSAFLKRLVGTGVVNMTMDNGSTWTDVTSSFGASGFSRVAIPAQTLANPTVGFRLVTNGDSIAVDFTQEESAAAASSPILTGAAAVTRTIDQVDMSWSAFPALRALREFTTDMTFEPTQFPAIAAGGTMFDISDGSDDNILRNNYRVSDFQAGFTVRAANAAVIGLDPLDTEGFFVETGKTSRFVTSIDMPNLQLSVSMDGSAFDQASVNPLPATISAYPAVNLLDRLRLGTLTLDAGAYSNALMGYLKRLTIYPRVYTPAEAAVLSGDV